MDSLPLELIIAACVAAVVLFLLYSVLGRKVGRQPEDEPEVTAPPQAQTQGAGVALQAPAAPWAPALEPAVAEGVAQLKARDAAFDPTRFIDGARQAYDTIVTAFHAGDRDTLKPLLAPGVMASFETAMTAREAAGRTEKAELTHAPRADLDHVEAQGDLARTRVRFLAEIRNQIEHEGVSTTEERRTAELWTFERRIGAGDPNWVLSRVEEARA